jgi:hypothetical protein
MICAPVVAALLNLAYLTDERRFSSPLALCGRGPGTRVTHRSRYRARVGQSARVAYVGIDLGLRYSSVAFINQNGRAEVIADPAAHQDMPSAVCFPDRDHVVVGRAAWSLVQGHPERGASLAKQHMGTDWVRSYLGRAYSAEVGVKLIDTSRPGWENDPVRAGYVHHLFHEGETLPAGPRSLEAATVYAMQTSLQIELYEQARDVESREMPDNRPVDYDRGQIIGLSPDLAGGSPINITLGLDEEGTLSVAAREGFTDRALTVQVRVNPLTDEQISQARTDQVGLIIGSLPLEDEPSQVTTVDSAPATASRVFMCYRRDDSEGIAGRISDELTRRIGAENVFIDVDSIEPGRDFVAATLDAVSACKYVLAIVGRGWLEIRRADGQRRLEQADDYVRVELETALQQGKRIIPILVQGAAMPTPLQLPPSLAAFGRLNAVRLEHQGFHEQMRTLLRLIEAA